MSDDLEERLRSHARSFDSLLSLIPAKLYYGEDVSDQWKRKKQTPEQKKAAKMAKLDPDNWKSAKDVMDERSAAAKRKRVEEDGENSDGGAPQVEPEQPKAVQDLELPKSKKQKVVKNPDTNPEPSERIASKAAKRALKRQGKAAEIQKQKAKKERQRARKAQEQARHDDENEWSDLHEEDDGGPAERIELENLPSNLLEDTEMADAASTASDSSAVSQIISPPTESASSSISSMQPTPNDEEADLEKAPKPSKQVNKKREKKSNQNTKTSESSKSHPPTVSGKDAEVPLTTASTINANIALTETDKAAAKDRLTAAISTFRSQRKADAKPRSRQQLLDLRRQKEDERRRLKKEQRQQEREAAALAADAEIEKRFSPGGSGSLLGSPRSPPTSVTGSDAGAPNNFSFGRIAFGDGTSAALEQSLLDNNNNHDDNDDSNSTEKINKKRKGPQDLQTALTAATNKSNRLSSLDPSKRKEIEEKDMWLNAKKRAHGERVKDDTSLLKKALKRQQSQKKKSEKEWTGRIDGVQKAQEIRQKKRNENLARRKDEKKHGKKAGGGGGGSKGKSKAKRAGFEGSFRGRSGSSGKKKS